MLVNGSLFGWALAGTPLLIWRQLIWIIGLWLSFKMMPSLDSQPLYGVFKVEKRFFFAIVILSFATVIFYHFNFTRIAFAFWVYFSGLPFVCFPVLVQRSRIISMKTFYLIFVYMGIFLTIGLITDYVTGGFFTKTFLISNAANKNLINILLSGRYCFLSEAPTIIGVFYTFCMFCGLMLMYISDGFWARFSYLIISGSFLVGSWFTGSRQILAVLALMYISGIIFYIIKAKKSISHIIVAGLLACMFLPTLIYSFMYANEAYTDRYSVQSLEEDTRSRAWKNGFRDTMIDDVFITLFGKAVALSQGQKAQSDEIVGSHYENSFFGRMSECGIIGLMLLCYPVVFILRRLGKWNLFQLLTLTIIAAYLITCFVSPNGQHQTSQMAIYLTLGIYIAREYFDPDYEELVLED